MNPVPMMQLVEVIRGMATSDAAASAVDALARRMGKTPIVCHDYPGFISNRVLMPMINEAIEALREGVATRVEGRVKRERGCHKAGEHERDSDTSHAPEYACVPRLAQSNRHRLAPALFDETPSVA